MKVEMNAETSAKTDAGTGDRGAEALAALQESQRLFLASLNAMQEGFTVQDWDGTILMCNRSAERILRLPPGGFTDRHVHSPGWRVVDEGGADLPRECQPSRLALRSGRAQSESVLGLVRPGQPVQWLRGNAAPLFHEGAERPYAVVQTFSDITDAKRASDTLRQTQERLRAVVENAPLVLFSLDAEGVFTASEGRGLEALGLAPGQVVGRSLFEVFGGGDVIEPSIRRALAGETVSYASTLGGRIWENRVGPLRGAGGAGRGMIGVSYDVTERHLAEERFRMLFERSSDAHLLLEGGVIVDCNAAAATLLRCAGKEALLSLHPAALSPEFQPDGRRSDEKGAEMDAVARQRGHHRFEWTHRRADGEDFPAEVALTAVSIGDKPVVLAVLHDLTERRLADERFRVLFERSPYAHLLFDEAGGIIDCNAATLSMMRCADKAQLLGTHPARLSPEFQPGGRRSDEKGVEMCALAWRNGGHRFEWRRRAVDGHEYPVEVTLTPVTLGGRPVLLSVWHDLTERKRAEEALRRSEERLRRLQDLMTVRGLTPDEKIARLLALGCEFFGLEIGALTHAQGRRQTFTHTASPGDAVPAGLTCWADSAYCAQVIRAGEVQAVAYVGASDWRDLPAYAEFGLEAYLGAPLWVGDVLHGTLCFAGAAPRAEPFAEGDKEILRLMAQWIGGEMAREETRQQIESYNIVLEFQMGEVAKANAELEALATTDALTGLKNRRAFGDRLDSEVARATRYGPPLSLLMLDVDHFKQYNDTFGHQGGDEVLRRVAALLLREARETDMVARYGGEEFVVLLPQTDARGALVVAERIRAAIEGAGWAERQVTASLGLSSLGLASRGFDMDGAALVAEADAALYRAKGAGRNRVIQAGHVAPTLELVA